MKILLVFYFSIFSINLFADNYIDSITLTKIKKLVQKEEEIALAYKKYLLRNGKLPLTNGAIDIKLLDLPKGFDIINPFGKEIRLINGNKIEGFKIERINKDSAFAKLGLKEGDIIKSVNNSVLESYADAFKVYNNMENTKYLNMEILRNNEIVELNYEID